MGRTKTLYIDLARLDQHLVEASVVVRLMMVCNDLCFANAQLGAVRERHNSIPEHVKWELECTFYGFRWGI